MNRLTSLNHEGRKEVARASHETCGEPVALCMRVIQHPDGLRADGSDMVLIETEVVDGKGRRCPLAQNIVHYQVEGPAVWRGGIWEEDVKKYANLTDLPVLNGVHRMIMRSTEQPGKIKVTAASEGLKSANTEIEAHDVSISNGTSRLLPATLPVRLPGKPVYGPDLAPAPPPSAGAFEQENMGSSATGEIIYGLTTAFPQGATLIRGAKDGAVIYKDRPWTFQKLPAYLVGADYLQVANDDAGIAVALLNRDDKPAAITVLWKDLKIKAGALLAARDLWAHKELGAFTDSISLTVGAHATALLKMKTLAQPARN